ncbi:MAG: SDR family NAD(P)-dependent oxidoreductase, partial [Paracoccaceae bacterium]
MVRSLLRPAGLSAGKDDLAGQLAGFLRKWADGTRPIEPGDEIALHGLDTAPLAHGREDLFLTQRADHVKRLDRMPVAMSNLDVLDTDSLRNAFFPEPFIRHSHFDRLRLTLEGQGAFHLSAQAIGEDGQRRVLAEGGMKAGEERLVLELGQIERLPRGVRLVAQAQALAGKARLTAMRWSAVAPARAEGRMVVVAMDVADPDSVRRGVARATEALGRIDGLVNNAGIAGAGRSLEMPDEEWQRVIDTNLSGVFRVAQAAARAMAERQG